MAKKWYKFVHKESGEHLLFHHEQVETIEDAPGYIMMGVLPDGNFDPRGKHVVKEKLEIYDTNVHGPWTGYVVDLPPEKEKH